ncbi:MAG: hypothetical protein ACD_37C00115G0001, partial [uncultured bacterium]
NLEALVQKEPAQWIVLAIIYTMGELQMAKAREYRSLQGTGNRRQVTGKKMKINQYAIPSRAVIFAFQ